MEEKIKQKNPTLHKYLFTVTTFSKLLVMFLFILLPFVGFYLGMQYQQQITVTAPIVVNSNNSASSTNSRVYMCVPVKWSVYKDSAHFFSINYPNNCGEYTKYNEGDIVDFLTNNNDFTKWNRYYSVEVDINDNNKYNLDGVTTDLKRWGNFSLIIINGYKGYRAYQANSYPGFQEESPFIATIIIGGNKIYYIILGYSDINFNNVPKFLQNSSGVPSPELELQYAQSVMPEAEAVYNKMLSSFKILE